MIKAFFHVTKNKGIFIGLSALAVCACSNPAKSIKLPPPAPNPPAANPKPGNEGDGRLVGDNPVELVGQAPLAGQYAGAPWKAVSATARIDSSGKSLDLVFVDSSSADPCSAAFGVELKTVKVVAPAKVGIIKGRSPEDSSQGLLDSSADSSAFTIANFAHFFADMSKGNKNFNTDNFVLRVDELSSTLVKGALAAKFDDSYVIDGTFEAKICTRGSDSAHDPNPPTDVKLPAQLTGEWQSVQVDDSGERFVTTYGFKENGATTLKLSYGATLLADVSMTGSNATDTVNGIDLVVTTVEDRTDGLELKVGDTLKCIQSLSTSGGSSAGSSNAAAELTLECGEPNGPRPLKYSADAQILKKI
jgi:hypothetical protein